MSQPVYLQYFKEDSDHMMPLQHAPVFFTADGSKFAAHAEKAAQDTALMQTLRIQAEKYYQREPFAVTKRKLKAASGNPHDYCSQGPYWWKNPNTPEGLPYIRRDGERNPESVEENNFGALFEAIEVLTFAAYYLENIKYAQKAVDYIRTWYLDPETRMNPDMNYGQSIPGVCAGRGIGIIDINSNWRMIESVQLLDAMGRLPEEVNSGLKAWYGNLLDWLLTSEIGVDEERQHNNHGTFYDIQVAVFALFLDRPILSERTLSLALERRLKKHVLPDGRQPHELARTNALSYSCMNLFGLMLLGKLAEHSRNPADFWQEGVENGKPLLRAAVDFLRPYAETLDGFAYQQIAGKPLPDNICRLLALAATEYPDYGYESESEKLYNSSMLWRLRNL